MLILLIPFERVPSFPPRNEAVYLVALPKLIMEPRAASRKRFLLYHVVYFFRLSLRSLMSRPRVSWFRRQRRCRRLESVCHASGNFGSNIGIISAVRTMLIIKALCTALLGEVGATSTHVIYQATWCSRARGPCATLIHDNQAISILASYSLSSLFL